MNNDLHILTVKEIVTQNFQTAAIFEKYSLDFCCRGGKTIEQACAEKGLDAASIINELSAVSAGAAADYSRFTEWPLDFLSMYIIINHHTYVRNVLPTLFAHTQKVSTVHGANHPEVVKIAEIFDRVAADLQKHMQMEEQILFPYIRQLLDAQQGKRMLTRAPFGSIVNPIRTMEEEHQVSGDDMYEIRRLSSDYVPPEDSCMTYRISFQELQEFERDLHQHVHLENNILFPKAIQLEEELFAKN
ncbi:MAG: iron-sulfur cluster repair di-iron protein [Bacteroidetes bacterium]|nr:iron-sulfur cluster repair di-iron protein [Bacteroidota bacterium]